MSVETGSTLAELQQQWPTGQDSLIEGDNHIRLIKAILKAQFPGVGGLGFSKVISATEDEINFLSGVTSSIQEQLNAITNNDALIAPAGTKLTFFQASPPVGWTMQTGANDAMLRVVSSGGGGSGGSESPISLTLAHTHTTQPHTLSVSEIPAHSHKTSIGNRGINTASEGNAYSKDNAASIELDSSTVGGGGSHNHGSTGSALSNWAPKYINVIIAVKD